MSGPNCEGSHEKASAPASVCWINHKLSQLNVRPQKRPKQRLVDKEFSLKKAYYGYDVRQLSINVPPLHLPGYFCFWGHLINHSSSNRQIRRQTWGMPADNGLPEQTGTYALVVNLQVRPFVAPQQQDGKEQTWREREKNETYYILVCIYRYL